MKVTYLMRPDGCLFFGGAEVQAIKTAEAVRKLGVDVEILTPLSKNLGDIVHAFGPYGSYTSTLNHCKNLGIPFALSTIFFRNYAHPLLAYRDRLRAKKKHNPMREMKNLMRNSSALLPNTNAELELVKKIFLRNEIPSFVVPNGAEERFSRGNPRNFIEKYAITTPFVLNVARIEDRKNQLNLIRAAKRDGFKLIIIGKDLHTDYSRQCKEEARGAPVRFIDPIPHEDPMLESAYAACDVFALPSTLETPGIAAIEAGLAGAKIVITPNGGPREYFGDMALYPNPKSEKDIAEKISSALRAPQSDALKNHLLQNYTWDAVAHKTIQCYEFLMKNKNNTANK